MWEINILNQVTAFLYSLLLGGIFCVFYDILRSVRKMTESSFTAVLIEDILYFTVCAPITFCFLLATTNGELRAFVLIGIVLGFTVVRVTVSSFILKIFTFIIGLISKMLAVINRGLLAFFDRINLLYDRFFKILRKFLQKAVKLSKKLLKKQ